MTFTAPFNPFRLILGLIALAMATACGSDGGNPPSALSYPAPPAAYIVGTSISPLTPTVTGTVDSYSVAPALPAGLSINATSGQISGTPTAVTASASYTVTAANSRGSTTATLTILVNPAAPTGLSYASPQVYTAGTAITALNPTVTGVVTSYSVAPALPAGLALNTTSGQISGTPTATTAQATYRVTATNVTGSSGFDLVITVNPAAPTALSYPSPQTYSVGTAISPLSPTVTGSVTTYSVAPGLPAGLTLNASTGQISGTPTAATAQAAYRVTAANVTGSTGFDLVLTVNAAFVNGWQGNPTPLHADGVNLGLITLALASNASGEAITAWSQAGVVWATRYTPATGWATRVSLSSIGPTVSNQDPDLAMNSAGVTLAVWRDGAVGNEFGVVAALFTPAGGWNAPVTLATADTSAGFVPKVAVAANGNALAVWTQRANIFSPWQLFARRYDAATASWSPALRLDTDAIGEPTANPDVAMNAAGDAIVLWPAPASAPGAFSLWARRLSASGGWGAATLVDAAVFASPQQQVAVDPNGNALAVYKRTNGSSLPEIWSSRFDAQGGAWSTPAALSINNVNRSTSPQVAFDASGQAVAAWVQFNGTQDVILSNRFTPGTGWGTQQQVAAGPIGQLIEPSLAVNAVGTAVLAWKQGSFNVAASIQLPGSSWRPPAVAPTVGSDGVNFSVALAGVAGLDGNGNATVVWLGSRGQPDYRVYGGRFR